MGWFGSETDGTTRVHGQSALVNQLPDPKIVFYCANGLRKEGSRHCYTGKITHSSYIYQFRYKKVNLPYIVSVSHLHYKCKHDYFRTLLRFT